MRNKKLIFMSVTLCLTILLSACSKRPAGEAIEDNTVTATNEVKEEKPKEEIKKEEPKTEAPKEEPKKAEPKKEEPKKQEVKKEAPKVAEKKTVTTNNTSKPVEQPKQAVAPATTKPTEPVDKDEFHTLMETAIPNNGKFKISFTKKQGPVPQNVDYTIDIPSNKSFYKKLVAYAVQNDRAVSMNSNLNTFDDGSGKIKLKGDVVIPQYNNNTSSTVDCYIVIKSSDDGKTYYEKMTYTITQ